MTEETQENIDGIFKAIKENPDKHPYKNGQILPFRLEFINNQGIGISLPVAWHRGRSEGPPFVIINDELLRDGQGNVVKIDGKFQVKAPNHHPVDNIIGGRSRRDGSHEPVREIRRGYRLSLDTPALALEKEHWANWER